MREDGRPDHIEDYLAKLHTQQWFGWSDSKNKIYANIRLAPKLWDRASDAYIDNPYSIPTEAQLNAKLKELQDAYDAEYEYEG